MNTHLLRRFAILAFLFLIVALLAGPVAGSRAFNPAPDPRVDPAVWVVLDQQAGADVLILLGGGPSLAPAQRLPDKLARGQWVYETLRAAAVRSQKPLLAELDRLGVAHQRFWIIDAVRARLTASQIERVLALPGIEKIVLNKPFHAQPLPEVELSAQAADAVAWGVNRVKATWAWDQGYRGQGVVVAGQDGGYDWDHNALIRAYRGYDGSTANHVYNWHDSIHEDIPPIDGSNPCGYDSSQPCDDSQHGTHTMGTMVGNDLDPSSPGWPAAASHAVGVAPAAKWIGCRNMDNGWGLPSTYIECFEWLTAPYPPGGDPMTDGDPSKAPDVINNSWGCPPSETCTGPEIEPALNAAEAAGIVVVVSAGNAGPNCNTVEDPPAIYPRPFAVGSTTNTDALSSFSSRGSVTYNGQTYLKPNISAPGSNITSSIPNNGYTIMSGTSMAGPHVVGVTALLLSAAPNLKGQPNLVETILQQTADVKTDNTCGGDADGHPNNSYGWGIVNAQTAIQSLSQAGALQGKVTDAGTAAAIVGATVTLHPLGDTGTTLDTDDTDASGNYSFSLGYGAYEIQVEKSGYVEGSAAPIYVVGGRTTTQDVALTAGPAAVSDLKISISGSNILLEWTHQDASIVSYEIWRALDQPYFNPAPAEATKLGEVTPVGLGGALSFTDTSSPLGNAASQGSYLVLGVNGSGQKSPSQPRKSEWDFDLSPGE